ncbi:MAG: hypothetical protein AAF721_22790 [Myxococcota bacterium]
MTLREGLAEYYQVNPGLSEPSKITNRKSATYFHNHDTTHVVFGTHTGLLDEAVNDYLTFFCVDIRARDYIVGFFATDESKKIAKQSFFKLEIVRVFWRSLKLLPRIWRHRKRMTKRWPWTPPAELMDRPLAEIRAEYGIEPFRPEVVLGLAGPTE